MLAAHRAGIHQVLLPEANRKDLRDIPDEVCENVDIRFTRDARENVEAALIPIYLPATQEAPGQPPPPPADSDGPEDRSTAI